MPPWVFLLQSTLPSVLLLSLLLTTGCGEARCGGVAVCGDVTWQGKPLLSGYITLRPVAGGASTGGPIEGGEFQVAAQRGPTPGSYRVEIVAHELTGRQIEDTDFPGRTAAERRQILPARYHSDSELTAQVSAEGKNKFSFALTAN